MKVNFWIKYTTMMILSLSLLSCSGGSEPDSTKIVSSKSSVEESQVQNDESPYQEGFDFTILEKAYDTEFPNQVVVYEFFGYTCPHCFHFEPFIEPWAQSKPEYVRFEKIPLNFHASWSVYQQAYLTAQAMGIADQAHAALFDAIHKDNRRFNSIEELAAWYADETGVDKDKFISTADSFIIDSNQRKADAMGFKMKITGTPTVIVDGKYKIVPKQDRQEEIRVLRFLTEKIAKEKGIL